MAAGQVYALVCTRKHLNVRNSTSQLSVFSVCCPILLYYSKDELVEDNNDMSSLSVSRCPCINECIFLLLF